MAAARWPGNIGRRSDKSRTGQDIKLCPGPTRSRYVPRRLRIDRLVPNPSVQDFPPALFTETFLVRFRNVDMLTISTVIDEILALRARDTASSKPPDAASQTRFLAGSQPGCYQGHFEPTVWLVDPQSVMFPNLFKPGQLGNEPVENLLFAEGRFIQE
jgi:hypothetical protein